ncbi:BglG family transcription antiterminator [Clostridiaceae bacterium M8S5]|nr:BglG family transcription antiterminator [Clostridiaceae bacterium M8S5]
MSYDARKGQIITEFIKSNGIVTAQYLSKIIGVSSRTIRNDIKLLNKELESKEICIKSKPKIGYIIEPFNASTSKFLERHITEAKSIMAILPKDRVHYILKKLLDNNQKFITLESLANELFVSKSTIDNDTEKVEELLNNYNLELLKKTNYGIKVIGDELQIRYMISNYIKDINNNIDSVYIKNLEDIFGIDTDSIKQIILDVYSKDSMKFSDIALQNLIIHIAVALKRIETNREIEMDESEFINLKNRNEYEIAKKITNELEKRFIVKIPESENAYITLHLLGIKSIKYEEFSMDNYKDDKSNELSKLIQSMIHEINNVYKIDFTKDRELAYGLMLHLKPTINRLKNNMSIRNPLLDEIKEKYPYAFEMAISASKVLQAYSNNSIDENEIGYLAMHLGAALERKAYRGDIKKISIICATGMGTAQLLASKIRNRFKDVIILGIFPSYKKREAVLQKPDLVIATVPVDINEIPVIQVSALFGKEDISVIANVLDNFEQYNEKCRLYELFDPQLYIKSIQSDNKYDVITMLSNILYNKKYVSEKFTQSTIDRENVSSTSTGNLLAIPHAFSGNVITSKIAVGILDRPIQWGENMVQIVMLLALEKMSSEEYEIIFNNLYSIVGDKKRVLELINSQSYQEFIRLLKW